MRIRDEACHAHAPRASDHPQIKRLESHVASDCTVLHRWGPSLTIGKIADMPGERTSQTPTLAWDHIIERATSSYEVYPRLLLLLSLGGESAVASRLAIRLTHSSSDDVRQTEAMRLANRCMHRPPNPQQLRNHHPLQRDPPGPSLASVNTEGVASAVPVSRQAPRSENRKTRATRLTATT